MDKGNLIAIEEGEGRFQILLDNIMRMVPERDKGDVALKRLLAFRLRTDGESATRNYLMSQIRSMIQCAYSGRMYDFLKNDQQSRLCRPVDAPSDPPDRA